MEIYAESSLKTGLRIAFSFLYFNFVFEFELKFLLAWKSSFG